MYFGNEHPHDPDFAVSGVDMHSYRTELQAVMFMLDGPKDWDTNTWVTLDNALTKWEIKKRSENKEIWHAI